MQKRMFITMSVLTLFLGACATMDDGGADVAAGTPYHDPHTVGIVIAANQGEVDQGNAAASRATNADVRAFAQMMVTDHTTALAAVRDTSSRAELTPLDNDTTAALQRGSRETITNLNTYSGADFDRTYMQSQVDLHQWLLNQLDRVLIPTTRNRDLRSLLETQRTSVAAHLEQARQIRGRL
jgi:putative membrane protein